MEIKINLSDYEVQQTIDKVVCEQITKIVEPKIAEFLDKELDNDMVAELVVKGVKHMLRETSYESGHRDNSSLGFIVDKHLSKAVNSISDDEFKKTILNRLLMKTT